jgi:hypothetical protein
MAVAAPDPGQRLNSSSNSCALNQTFFDRNQLDDITMKFSRTGGAGRIHLAPLLNCYADLLIS